MSGWIKIHRQFINWEWFNKSEAVHLFIYLVLKANHKDAQWQGIDIKKGQQASTSLQLSKDLKNVTKSIQELNLKDPKLQEFETSFIKIFDHLSEAIAKASQALADTKKAEASSDGRVKVEKARREIDSALTTAAKTAGKESDALGVQLNKYCSQAEAAKN